LGVLGCMAGIREIIGKGALSRGGPVAMVLFAAAGIAGVTLLRWGIGRRTLTAEHGPAREPAPAALLAVISQRLLAIASAYGGRVTAAEVAAALAIEQRPAQRVLDEAVTTGAARLLFSPDGIPVYEFPGLVARKRDAKEPWAL
jgi:hypothetical protein